MPDEEAEAYVRRFAAENPAGVARFEDYLATLGVGIDPSEGLGCVDTAWLAVRDRLLVRDRPDIGTQEVPDWNSRLNRPSSRSPHDLWLADGLARLSCAVLLELEPRCRWGRETFHSYVWRNYPGLILADQRPTEIRYLPLQPTLARMSWFESQDTMRDRRINDPDYMTFWLRDVFLGGMGIEQLW